MPFYLRVEGRTEEGHIGSFDQILELSICVGRVMGAWEGCVRTFEVLV